MDVSKIFSAPALSNIMLGIDPGSQGDPKNKICWLGEKNFVTYKLDKSDGHMDRLTGW